MKRTIEGSYSTHKVLYTCMIGIAITSEYKMILNAISKIIKAKEIAGARMNQIVYAWP